MSLREKRAAEKAAARKRDEERIKEGESPGVIQRENSVFPPGRFAGVKVRNRASTVGK